MPMREHQDDTVCMTVRQVRTAIPGSKFGLNLVPEPHEPAFTKTLSLVVPGAGKSLDAMIQAMLLKHAGLIDKALWVVPNRNLGSQAILTARDPRAISDLQDLFPEESIKPLEAVEVGYDSSRAPVTYLGDRNNKYDLIVMTHDTLGNQAEGITTVMGYLRILLIVDEFIHFILKKAETGEYVPEGQYQKIKTAGMLDAVAYLNVMGGSMQRAQPNTRSPFLDYIPEWTA